MKRIYKLLLCIFVFAASVVFFCACDNNGQTQTPVDGGNTTEECAEHKYEKKKVVQPTCEQGGYTLYVCSVCNRQKQDDAKAALGHSMGGYKVTKAAGCTTEGLKKRTCIRCGSYTETEAIPSVGHDYISYKVAATCKSQGYTWHRCSVCKESYKDEYVDITDHLWTEMTLIETEQGELRETRSCTICEQVDYYDVTDVVSYYHERKSNATSYTYKINIILYVDYNGDKKMVQKTETWIDDDLRRTSYTNAMDYKIYVYEGRKYVAAAEIASDGTEGWYKYELYDDTMTAAEALVIPSFRLQTKARLFKSDTGSEYEDLDFGEIMTFYMGEGATLADLPEPPEYEGYEFEAWHFNEGALEGSLGDQLVYAFYYPVS